MILSKNTGAAASDEAMFGCECALPFLTLLQPHAARRLRLSSFALGAVVALGACDTAADTAPQSPPQDKVSAAIAKVDREIARAKARWNRDDPLARSDDAGGSAPRRAPAVGL